MCFEPASGLAPTGKANRKRRRRAEPPPAPSDDAPWWEHADHAETVAALAKAQARAQAQAKARARARAEAKAKATAGDATGESGDETEGPSVDESADEVGSSAGDAAADEARSVAGGETDEGMADPVVDVHAEERNLDDGGLHEHVDALESEARGINGNAVDRHLESHDHVGGLVIHHPPHIDGKPASYSVSEQLTATGLRVNDCYVDAHSGECVSVADSKVLGKIWQCGTTWKCECSQHAGCTRALPPQVVQDHGIGNPQEELVAWLIRGTVLMFQSTHSDEPRKLLP